MKLITIKKLPLAIAIVVLGLVGCKKLNSTYLDTSLAIDHVILQFPADGSNSNTSPTSYQAGLSGFKNASIVITGSSPDTLKYTIVAAYASTGSVAPKDVAVTLGVDDGQRTTYNSASSINYMAFKSNMYRLVSTAITIKSGTTYATSVLEVYPKFVDLSQSWMLPISIISAGAQLSSNQNTMYFHIIGNPLGGSYNQEWIRYNNDGGTGTPSFDQMLSATFLPVDPLTISVTSGTGVAYILNFTNTNGVYSNFNVSFPTDATDPGSAAYNGITITTGPTIILADPINKKFTFNFHYLNGSGAARNITDKFSH